MLVISVIALFQIGIWGILDLAGISLSRGLLPDPNAEVSPEATRIIYAVTGNVLLNLIGLIWFLVQRRGLGTWLLVAAFGLDLAGSVFVLANSDIQGGLFVLTLTLPTVFSAAIGAMLVLSLRRARG